AHLEPCRLRELVLEARRLQSLGGAAAPAGPDAERGRDVEPRRIEPRCGACERRHRNAGREAEGAAERGLRVTHARRRQQRGGDPRHSNDSRDWIHARTKIRNPRLRRQGKRVERRPRVSSSRQLPCYSSTSSTILSTSSRVAPLGSLIGTTSVPLSAAARADGAGWAGAGAGLAIAATGGVGAWRAGAGVATGAGATTAAGSVSATMR